MRTTVNIRSEALELCKKRARERGVSLGDVISDAVLEVCRDKPAADDKPFYDLPVSKRKGGTFPGIDLDNNAAVLDIMEGVGDSS